MPFLKKLHRPSTSKSQIWLWLLTFLTISMATASLRLAWLNHQNKIRITQWHHDHPTNHRHPRHALESWECQSATLVHWLDDWIDQLPANTTLTSIECQESCLLIHGETLNSQTLWHHYRHQSPPLQNHGLEGDDQHFYLWIGHCPKQGHPKRTEQHPKTTTTDQLYK